jgi:DHA2 family multidrug resistance protein
MASIETPKSEAPVHAPLKGLKLAVAATFSAGATFLVLLDTTIAHVSIPSIAADLGASPNEGTWVVTSYAVADAISVCFTGWLSGRLGPARTMAIAMAGFGFASAMCGLSTSLAMLVFFRVMQGAFGGPLISLSPVLLFNMFPTEKRSTAFAIWAATSNIAPILGPTMGGYICDTWSWPWIFLINVPFALLMSFGIWRLLRHRDPAPLRAPVDAVGIGIMIVWIAAAQFVFDRGLDLDWFGSNAIIAATIIAVVGFIAFLIWELTEKNPIVDLRIFRNRTFAGGCFAMFFIGCVFYGSLLISPLWLQTNLGYTPARAGLVAAPMGVVMFFLTPLVAGLVNRTDPRYIMTGGLFLLSGVLLWRGHFASNVTIEMVVMANIAFGFGAGLTFPAAMNYTMSKLKPDEVAGGSGMIGFVRTIGIAFATALLSTAWHDAAIVNRAGVVERINGPQGIAQIEGVGIPAHQTLGMLDRIVQEQAVMLATNDIYIMLAVVMALLPIAVWTTTPRRVKIPRTTI